MLNVPYQTSERPPFVRFEDQEAGINVEASQAAGRPVPRIQTMACITSFGSKDEFIKPADDWLADIRNKAVRGEYNPQWVERFKLQYEEYRKGNELPREGTPMMTCPMYTKDQVVRCRAINVTTVEDLAQVPDSGLPMLGLDGRHMRDMARSWLIEAKDKGAVSRALADANTKIEQMAKDIEQLRARTEAAERKSKDKAA